MTDKNHYLLEINQNQAAVLQKALELYSRLLGGQIYELRNLFADRWKTLNYNEIESLLEQLKRQIFPELESNAYYGVGNKVYPESTVAWDVMQVIRHRLAWDCLEREGKEKPDFYGVQYKEPMKFGEEELAKIQKVEKKERAAKTVKKGK